MRNVLLLLFFGLSFFGGKAQITKPDRTNDLYRTDTTRNNRSVQVEIKGETKYTDYKMFSINNDTIIIDTTLTVQKDYKHNFIRKDNFEYMEFHNQGQTFNKLSFDFTDNSILPSMGFNAKQRNYYQLSDIYYYRVPTPTSEIMYRKGLQQGQVLDALLTANTSNQLNFSASYKGLRSLGRYQHVLSSHGNFRFTFNYNNKNKTYFVRGHMYTFDFFNEQNGGLTPQSVIDFENDNPDYTNRSRLEVNYTDADNIFDGKRYYLEQSVILVSNNKPVKKERTTTNSGARKMDSIQRRVQRSRMDSISKTRTAEVKDSINNYPVAVKDSLQGIPIIVSDSTYVSLDSVQKRVQLSRIDSISKTRTAEVKDTINNSPVAVKDSIRGNPHVVSDSTAVAIDSVATKKSILKDSTLIAEKVKKPLLNLKLGNTLLYETKHYRFNQNSANSIYGDAFSSTIKDHTSYQKFDGQLFLQLNSAYVGSLKFKTNYFDYNYHYNSILYYDDYTVSDKLKGNAVSIGADWVKNFGNIYLKADASTILFGDINGSSLKASIAYQNEKLFNFQGYVEFASKSPDFNKLLYQSNYVDYNWQTNFKNKDITSIGGAFNSEKWGNIIASYNTVDNYVYFNEESTPVQADATLNYFKVKLLKAFTYRKFTLDNTILYQNVVEGNSFFRTPDWMTRNTLYFASDLFAGDPLYLETGITFRYFSSFKMNAYNPLIGEFTLQNNDEVGDFPIFDYYVNLRIQRTRIFFKFENISAAFTGRNYYSAPTYPYRDFTFRIGLVWNFFI